MIILESKLRVPNYSLYLVRNRLLSFIENHLDRSLICLTSDGGYGKTTLISSFVKEKKLPAVWYQLSQQDRNPHTFLSYMKTAILRRISGEQMIYDVRPEQIDEELDHLSALLSTWPTRLIIILDQYQSVDQCEEIQHILTRLIENASPSVTFIITSRTRPSLQLVSLKLQNRLAELHTKELAFTKDEIGMFFVDLHGIALQENEIDLIYHKTEGWVTSLQLLKDLIKEVNDADRPSFWLKFNGTPDINDYLSAEILASQSEEIRDFLYKTCLLTDINSNVINKFLGIHNADEILEHLLRNHLFIYKNNLGMIKYHKLFRSFLYRELSKRHSSTEIDEFHQKLSLIYEKKSDFIHAFVHSVMGSQFINAATLMKSMKERFTRSQFLTLIDKLSENFSPDLTFASISLFLFRCIPLDMIKDLITPLEINFKSMNGNMNPKLSVHFQHQLAAIYYFVGEMNKAEQLCSNSLNESLSIKDQEMICKNLSLQAMLCMKTGRQEEAVQCAQEALSYRGTYSNYHPHHMSLCVLAEIYLDQNKLLKADSLIKETLKLSEERFDCAILFPYRLMGKYYRLQGDYQEAFAWFRKAEDIGVQFHLDYDLGNVYLEMVAAYMETGQWEEAELYLSKSSVSFTHNIYLSNKVKQMQQALSEKRGSSTSAVDMAAPTPQLEAHRPLVVQEPEHAKISIRVLGKFEIQSGDQIVTLKRKSSLRLLQFFITHRESKLTKDSIIDEIFPEGSFEAVNNQFYVTLSYLRKTLEPQLKSGRDSLFIKQSGEHYTLSLDHMDLDIHQFTQLIHKGEYSSLEHLGKLKKAELLYRGDYFEEYPYVSFLELVREKIRVYYLKVLQELAVYYWDQADYEQGISYFEKALRKEPYEESVYLEYMERLMKANLVLQAKKVSELYQKYIEKELGIPVQAKLQKMFHST
ncbi:BTAD domain-containing putative transcriptional regulator [Paenibacillus sp.]|uniref:BTAD domain-containing putative transcriptional regulator n=1 Tax=Paenibacillus sp. TaxID=58172 RepID=UPI00356A2FDC